MLCVCLIFVEAVCFLACIFFYFFLEIGFNMF